MFDLHVIERTPSTNYKSGTTMISCHICCTKTKLSPYPVIRVTLVKALMMTTQSALGALDTTFNKAGLVLLGLRTRIR